MFVVHSAANEKRKVQDSRINRSFNVKLGLRLLYSACDQKPIQQTLIISSSHKISVTLESIRRKHSVL